MTEQRESLKPNHASLPEVEKEVKIFIGGVHASEEAIVISTLLGSCIAVCLYDESRRVGGMNHFMLPNGGGDGLGPDASRFGVHAMDRLIGAMVRLGVDRRRLVAKVFGGAHVLGIRQPTTDIPKQNIAFVREFFASDGIPLLNEDLGGHQPRDVRFYTATGQVFVRKLAGTRAWKQVTKREQPKQPPPPPQYGKVILFDQE